MSKVKIEGCGGSHEKAELNIPTNDFTIEVNGKFYRMQITQDGSLEIMLINGVDARFTTSMNYPTLKLIHR